MIRRASRMLAVAVVLSLAAGCGAISALGQASVPLDAYDLRLPEMPAARRISGRSLVVEVPGTSGALDTDRILIRPEPNRAQYLPGVRWTDKAAVMMQALLIRGLDDTGGLRFVGRRPLGGVGDVALVSELTDFEAELAEGNRSATVRVRLVARLVREADATVLAGRSFSATAVAADTSADAVVRAFNAATDALLPDVAVWVLGRLGPR